jgi:hypothetical protein
MTNKVARIGRENSLRGWSLRFLPVVAILALVAKCPPLLAGDPAWQPMPVDEAKAQSLAWLEQRKDDAALRPKAESLWQNSPTGEEEVLDRVAATFALADPDAKKLVELCAAGRKPGPLPSQAWLGVPSVPPFEAANLRLYYARWLVQQSLFDEAREQLSGLQPADVVAPSVLLFYQSVVYHKLLERESGLQAIDSLLQGPESSPRRYRTVAKLMQEDLKALDEDSLDHIARRMDDIHRRLDLGRAGPKVRQVEDGVIESLDKLIKKLEEEQQQQQQQQQNANNLRPNKPAQDSKPAGGKGPGDVAKRNIGNQSDWGDLPPKEREEALQQIGRDLPANYRDVIEQYFKRMASEEHE